MSLSAFDEEVDRNYDAFCESLGGLLDHHAGEFALMRSGEFVSFHPTESSAIAAGRAAFSDGVFSVQEVTARPADLGFFSHAINTRIA